MRLANASPVAIIVNRHHAPATGAWRAVALLTALVVGAALAACAQAATTPTTPVAQNASSTPSPASADGMRGLRIQVGTVVDWPSLPALAARIAAIAGVKVHDIAGIAPQRVAVTLECADAAACDAAVERLAAERSVVAEVAPDARRKLPTRPPRSEAK